MGRTLIVAEKPSVAGDIAKALGGFTKGNGHFERSDVIVAHARGHLIEIFSTEAEKGGKSLGDLPVIPPRFELRPTKDAGPMLRHLLSLMKDSSVTEVVNACDAGREGELIFRLIYDYAGCRKPMRRMWFQSMTQEAISEAWKSRKPGSEYQGLADAAYCRSEADWIVGINGTRGVTQLHTRQSGAYELKSVGRVQTPTLSLVVERERAIRSFVAQDYWEVRGTFGVAAGSYVGKWYDASGPAAAPRAAEQDSFAEEDDPADDPSSGQRIFDKSKAEALVAKCQGVVPSRVTEESKRTEEKPQLLFDLTSLQREANKRFKFSAKKTLDIAQALYETHKVTTYPRTDSNALPEDYVATAANLMTTFAGSAYGGLAQPAIEGGWVQPIKRIFDNSQISDHFAIIPTGARPANLSDDELKIYDLVVRRFIAAFYPNAIYQTTTRVTVVAEEHFRTSGRVMVQPGWRAVWGGDRQQSGAPSLCSYAAGEPVRNMGVAAVGCKTKPPSRYTEGTLLGAMEKAGRTIADSALRAAISESGLGTPATRAATIENLLSAGTRESPRQPYMVREGKEQFLVPTDKADGLYEFLTRNSMAALTSAKMTAEWETKLLDIRHGRFTRGEFMSGIGRMAHSMIDVLKGKAADLPEPTQRVCSTPCPRCGGELRGHRKLECSCGFGLWTSVSERALSPDEITDLLTKRRTAVLKGFHSNKTKRNFDAALVLKDDFTVGFEFPDSTGAGSTGGAAAKTLGIPCPNCEGELRQVGGDRPRYACVGGDFTLWTTIAKRSLSDAEASRLVRTGTLPTMNGFVSSAGKKFAAGLRLLPDGKVEFVF